MARFKVTPVDIKTGNEAPSSIHDFDENRPIEPQAEAVCFLVRKYPQRWVASTRKLSPCKIDMRGGRDQ